MKKGRRRTSPCCACSGGMHPAIAGFVNDFVYSGQLYNAPETSGRAALAAAVPCQGAALTLVDLSNLPALLILENPLAG